MSLKPITVTNGEKGGLLTNNNTGIEKLFATEGQLFYPNDADLTNDIFQIKDGSGELVSPVPGGSNPTTATVGQLVKTIYFKTEPGYLSRIKRFSFKVTAPCRCQGYIKLINTDNALAGGLFKQGMVQKFGVEFDATDISSNSRRAEIDLTGITFNEDCYLVFNIYATTTTYPLVYGMAPIGMQVSNNYFPTAKYVYGSLGNSIALGTLGFVTTSSTPHNAGETHYSERIGKQLRAAGFDVRVTKRGANGARIGDIVNLLKMGGLSAAKPFDLCTIESATNDALFGLATAAAAANGYTFQQNIEYVLDWLWNWNPNMSIILVAPHPTDDTTRTTNIPSYRTALQDTVNSGKYASKKAANQLKYYTSESVLTVNDTNYVETVNGTRIHPRGNTGHVIISDSLYPVVQSTKFVLDGVNQ